MYKNTICIIGIIGLFLSMPHSVSAIIEKKEFPAIKKSLDSGQLYEKLLTLKKIQESGLAPEVMKELLEPALESDDVRVRFFAIQILYQNGDTESVEVLFRYVSDASYARNERLRAIATITSLNDKDIISRFSKLLDQIDDDIVKLAMIDALLKIKPLESEKEQCARLLKQYLREGSVHIKLQVLDILAKSGKRGVPIIKTALDDEDITVQNRAFETLGALGGPSVKDAFRKYLDDDNHEVAYNAAYSLGAAGEKNYYRIITDDLLDEDPTIRMRSLNFVATKFDIDTENPIFPIVERMSKYDNDEAIRLKAEMYLNQLQKIQRYNTADKQ